jgi:nucleotide-binding universal stress UspA family protein
MEMYANILVPLDGSKRAERILPYIENLAHGFNSRVVFLQVVETSFVYKSPYSYDTVLGLEKAECEKLRAEAKAYLAGLQGEFREKGIKSIILVLEGPVVQIIINVAEREGVDLIAMASHGRTGLARVFYGSVAAGVMHQVDRPLLIIRSEGEV